MDLTAIVAIPVEGDKVYQISSEKVPHLTLLVMPSDLDPEVLQEIVLYVQHAASELSPVYLSVDYRGELGSEAADVAFFDKRDESMKRLAQFRHHLLLHDPIKKAVESIDQFPEWTPHITLGYPDTPANNVDEGHSTRLYAVDFDRIAVFTGEYEGAEFQLKYDTTESELLMSDGSTLGIGALAASQIFPGVVDGNSLAQYGTKGMRWGVRKDRSTSKGGASSGPTAVVVSQKKPGKYSKAKGGEGNPAHPDATNALATRQVAKSSTTDALSNTELKTAIERMQLETRYNQLEFSSDRRSSGLRFIAGLVGKKKPTKFKDMNEEVGADTRKVISEALAYKLAKKAAKAA